MFPPSKRIRPEWGNKDPAHSTRSIRNSFFFCCRLCVILFSIISYGLVCLVLAQTSPLFERLMHCALMLPGMSAWEISQKTVEITVNQIMRVRNNFVDVLSYINYRRYLFEQYLTLWKINLNYIYIELFILINIK